jgi:hypothetical protein
MVGMLAASSLAGQTVMRSAPPLDSASATLRDALVVLRDSLATIDGAAARLQRDYQTTSGQALLSRARMMRDACARSVKTVPPTRKVLLSTEVSGDQKIKHRRELVSAMDSLRRVLVGCETEFTSMSQPGQGERVRGFGNDRAVRVQTELRRYDHVLMSFLQTMGIRIRPLGAGTSGSAG